MLRLWDAVVTCAALLGVVINGFGVMLRIIEASEGLRRIGVVAGSALLLTILPPIIVGIWSGLSLWQKVGILGVLCALLFFIGAQHQRHQKGTSRGRQL